MTIDVMAAVNVAARVEVELDREVYSNGNTSMRVFGTIAYTYGRNETDNEPVTRIPPFNGTAGVRVEQDSGRWWSEFFMQWAARQDRLSSGDVSDVRIPAGGTSGWATLNLRGGVNVNENLSINAGLMNLEDVRYRIHGSGIDAPGLNAMLSLECRF
ncbi:MAG: TonB-dependent receptor [Planctomycetes bacterium]|nr:TonB-dependent receptor [Planctomycetota bacterium]